MAKSVAAKPATLNLEIKNPTATKRAPAKRAAAKPTDARSRKNAAKRSPRHAKLFELGHHLTHAVAIEAALKGTIKASEIYKRLLAILHKTYIDYGAPVSQYIPGEDPVKVVRAFAITLDHYKDFKDDGLNLSPGDLTDCETMGDIGAAIVAWYDNHGWMVLPE